MTNITLPFDVEQIRFINNYSEEEFEKYYPTYLKLVNKYNTELVDEFINCFDYDPSNLEKFEDLYVGHFETGQDFADYWVNEICEEFKDIPSWITQKIMLRLIVMENIPTDTFLKRRLTNGKNRF